MHCMAHSLPTSREKRSLINRKLTKVHDVGLIAIDKELERMTHDEDQDDAHQDRGHVKVPTEKNNG